MENFLTVLAWIFGVLSSLLVILRIIGAANYGELEEALDALKGVKKTYPVAMPGTIAIICWAWIIAA